VKFSTANFTHPYADEQGAFRICFQILNEIENHFKIILMFSVYNMFNETEKGAYKRKGNSQKSHVFMMVASIFQKIYSWKSK